jgi:hypothetical protein
MEYFTNLLQIISYVLHTFLTIIFCNVDYVTQNTYIFKNMSYE